MIKLAGLFLICSVAAAQAGKAEVSQACEGDYFTHCSQFTPYSAPCKACMRAAGLARKLSSGCLRALASNGFVSKRDKLAYHGKKR